VTFLATTHGARLIVSALALLCAVGALLAGAPQAQGPAKSILRGDRLRFAVIGDFGYEGQAAADVAALVRGWEPDLIITTGDNNYPNGAASTIDGNIGRYYAPFIAPYAGAHGPGAAQNMFFPSLGNHDWEAPEAQPYVDFFTLPGNERYYDFAAGPVHFFALDSDQREPDGITADSRQAAWLRDRLPRSGEAWRIVYLHHPPYSSGDHGNTPETQWPYEEWGATAVLAGHEHSYERLQVAGIPYFVNGLGGAQWYGFRDLMPESRARVTGVHGAMLVEASDYVITYRFYTTDGVQMDTFRQCRQVAWRPGVEGCFTAAWGGRSR
jgi:hypothetical protein